MSLPNSNWVMKRGRTERLSSRDRGTEEKQSGLLPNREGGHKKSQQSYSQAVTRG